MVNSLKLCALALSLVTIAKCYSVDSVDGETTTEVPPPPESFTTIKMIMVSSVTRKKFAKCQQKLPKMNSLEK